MMCFCSAVYVSVPQHYTKNVNLESYLDAIIQPSPLSRRPLRGSAPSHVSSRVPPPQMMKHAWDSYRQYSWGHNELKPLAKKGHSTNIFGKPLPLAHTHTHTHTHTRWRANPLTGVRSSGRSCVEREERCRGRRCVSQRGQPVKSLHHRVFLHLFSASSPSSVVRRVFLGARRALTDIHSL